MALNKVLPTSIILEIIMICLHGTTSAWDTYPHNSWLDVIDEIYMSCVPITLFGSVIWVVYLRSHKFTHKARNARIYQAGLLGIIGGLMLWTAFAVRKVDENCNNKYGGNKCEAYELRTISGLLAFIDGFLHLFRPTLLEPHHLPPAFPSIPSNGVYIISNDLPSYEPPPSYFDLPLEQQMPQGQELPLAGTAHVPERV